MKKLFSLILAVALLAGCTAAPATTGAPTSTGAPMTADLSNATHLTFVDGDVTIKGDTTAVDLDRPIVYYEEGRDFTYGEGETWQMHPAQEAAEHTVVTITKPGTYVLSGQLLGQVAVDLGEGAETDPGAVVTLVLSGVDITCTVAPAVIFYNVYECGDKDHPQANVDTSKAGANVFLAAGTENLVTGSHVARIYKPGTVVLSEDGAQVAEAKKLHKYDGAFYSKMSLNVGGEGSLTIHADNEGLDSELHLTIQSGDIDIFSGNDGINTNEDGVSVTTMNGGSLTITCTGSTGEGDGIDSNGWLVINGGTLNAWACGSSGDSGIDADMGILLNGGTVCAAGNMIDRMEGNYTVFAFEDIRKGGEFTLKNADGAAVLTCTPMNSFRYLVVASPELTEGTYTLWSGITQFQGSSGQGGAVFGPSPIQRPDWPDKGAPDVEIPPQPTQPVVTQGVGAPPAEGDRPEAPGGMTPPDGFTPPEGERPEAPDGNAPPNGFRPGEGDFEEPDFLAVSLSPEFAIVQGGNYFSHVTEYVPLAG